MIHLPLVCACVLVCLTEYNMGGVMTNAGRIDADHVLKSSLANLHQKLIQPLPAIQLPATPLTGSGWPFEKIRFSYPIQSPVNINTSRATHLYLIPLTFHRLLDLNITLRLTNNGHTVLISVGRSSLRPFITGGPLHGPYQFEQVHFHWGINDTVGGEHMINGKRFSVEGHAVYFKREYGSISEAVLHDDGLAVIVFFAQAGNVDNPKLARLVELLAYIQQPGSTLEVPGKDGFRWFVGLGDRAKYYTYPGSLTTPPYSENVIFIVFANPLRISHKQIKEEIIDEGVFVAHTSCWHFIWTLFSESNAVMTHNEREIQAFNDRPLIYAI